MRFLILVLCLSNMAYAQLTLTVKDPKANKPGDLVDVEMSLSAPDLMEKLTPSNLQNSFIPEALWFMSVGTWQLSGSGLKNTARVALGTKFTDQPSKLTVAGREIQVSFENFHFSPGEETEGKFIYQEVPWYQRPWWKKHGIALLTGLLAFLGIGVTFVMRWQKKRLREKLARAMVDGLLQKLESARDLTSISQVWVARDDFNTVFPDKVQPLRNFFDVLNQYQFKPNCAEHELREIIEAKKKLIVDLKGGSHGV